MKPEEIFSEAISRPPSDRPEYIARICGDDHKLRQYVEALVHAHENPESFLAPQPVALGATIDEPVRERPGTVIGPYKLLEQIGEGGMGAVWMAQQTEPVKRLVAVKLIKAGMDSKQVIARFEAERQALALMDHPNIAKVLDAGTTTGEPGGVSPGRPYFVMELVKGAPITKYCDEHHLTPRQRLELFVPVCHAIQHAHQKGIIHRDLKPSNIIIALFDGKPVPKVIDFGVAKAVGQSLTDKTLVTGFGAIVGTLEYMSPEQAEVNQLDIDTRSDIYSLGVLLYELLTGSPPFSRKELEKAGMLEMLRVIREQEPSKPSTKLSSSNALPTLSANRGTEPVKLTKLVRGELDWIVMKALEKERNRRYETANALAADVQLYLADEPVQAGPPSARYRLRKFMRRNKKAMFAVTAFMLLLLAATGTSIGLASWALRERNHAEGQKQIAVAKEKEEAERAEEMRTVLEFVEEHVFATARPLGQDGGLGRDVTMRQAMESALAYIDESFRDRPLIEARLRLAIGTSFLHLGDGKTAETQFERARAIWVAQRGADHPNTLAANTRLATAYYVQGWHREAQNLTRKTLELQKVRLGPDHRDTLTSMNNLAVTIAVLGHRDEAITLFEEVLARQKNTLGADHPDTIRSLSNLARYYCMAGRNAEALAFGEEAFRRRSAKYGPDHPETLRTRRDLGEAYAALGRHVYALEFREETLRLHKDKLSLEHPQTVLSMGDVGSSYYALGRFEDAVKLREEVLPLMKAKFGVRGFQTLSLMNDLAASYEAAGRHEAAEKMREQLRQGMKPKHGPGLPRPQSKTSDGK